MKIPLKTKGVTLTVTTENGVVYEFELGPGRALLEWEVDAVEVIPDRSSRWREFQAGEATVALAAQGWQLRASRTEEG